MPINETATGERGGLAVDAHPVIQTTVFDKETPTKVRRDNLIFS